MNNCENEIGKATNKIVRRLGWFLTLVLASVAAGCGSGGGNAILGATGVSATTGLAPGASCPIAGPTNPVLSASDPSNGNQFATTSTTGVANSGKSITATFSLPLTASSITASSFTVTPAGGVALTPTLPFTYVPSTSVATFTTTSALMPNTNYTADVTTAITSSTGVPMACSYSWNFKTATSPSAGIAPVNLATATPFAIATPAGITNTASVSVVNGDVVLSSTITCNGAPVDNVGGIGPCGGTTYAPTVKGIVITPTYPDATTAPTVMTDFIAAYTSLAALPATPLCGATIGSGGCASTLPSGVYASSGASIGVTGNLTLDGGGDSNARFVFQAASTITTAAQVTAGLPGSQIILINGAKASNVWWLAGTATTIGTYSIFNGNVLEGSASAAAITMGTGSTSCGRLLTKGAAITFDNSIASVPGNAFAPPGCQ